MGFIAFLLGAAFAWLIDRAWIWFLAKLKSDEQRHRWRIRRNRTGYALVLTMTFVIARIFFEGIWDKYNGIWFSPFVELLNILTLPSTIGGIIAFTIGAIGVVLHRTLRDFLVRVYAAFIARSAATAVPVVDVGGVTPSPEPGTEKSRSPGSAARETYPWLTAIVGIAAVTLLAIITLVVFFPDALSRVESIKVAGVEARFATAANRSVRIASTASSVTEPQPAKAVLNKWTTCEQAASSSIYPTQALVNDQWQASDNDREKARLVWDGGEIFCEKIVKPLSKVVACYSDNFEIRDTEAQDKLVKIAYEWARIFKTGNDVTLEGAVDETYEFMHRIDNELIGRASTCEDGKQWPRLLPDNIKCEFGCRNTDIFRAEVKPIVDALRPKLAALTTNGKMIAFIADIYIQTNKRTQAVAFMQEVAKQKLDRSDGTLLAQYHFYSARYEAKFATRSESKVMGDLKKAREYVERLIAMIDKKSKGSAQTGAPMSTVVRVSSSSDLDIKNIDLNELLARYKADRIGIINNQLYSLILDWLDGQRLGPDGLRMLEGIPNGGPAYEMSEWTSQQSVSSLSDRAKGIGRDASYALNAIGLIGNVYDTLALREIVTGAIHSDLTRERCARILGHLINARRILTDVVPSILKDQDDPQIQESLRTVAAHYTLYENACSP